MARKLFCLLLLFISSDSQATQPDSNSLNPRPIRIDITTGKVEVLDNEYASKILGNPKPEKPSVGWVTITSEDFEVGFPRPGWITFDDNGSTGGSVMWGTDDYVRYGGGYLSAYCARGGANGVNPWTQYYPSLMDSRMIFGPFDLSDATDGSMVFKYWLQCPDPYPNYTDFFWWGFSNDFQHYVGWQHAGNFSSWLTGQLDLPLGENEVWVGFGFISDGGASSMKGVFVDNIILESYKSNSQGLYVGIGTGVTGNQQNHIDTYQWGTSYDLFDVTRRAGTNPHGHNGQMPINSSIQTYKWLPFHYYSNNTLSDLDNVWNDTIPYQASAVDAHVFAGLTYDYILHKLGWNSFDSLGKSMFTTVDSPFDTNQSGFHPSYDQVTISVSDVDNLGLQRRSLAGCIDLSRMSGDMALRNTPLASED